MSAPLELVKSNSPEVLDDAVISPIAALFMAVIVVAKLVTLEKLIAFPLILILE